MGELGRWSGLAGGGEGGRWGCRDEEEVVEAEEVKFEVDIDSEKLGWDLSVAFAPCETCAHCSGGRRRERLWWYRCVDRWWLGVGRSVGRHVETVE